MLHAGYAFVPLGFLAVAAGRFAPGTGPAARHVWMAVAVATIMRGIHDTCYQTADEYGVPGDYVLGANIAGFVRVAESMRMLGVI